MWFCALNQKSVSLTLMKHHPMHNEKTGCNERVMKDREHIV